MKQKHTISEGPIIGGLTEDGYLNRVWWEANCIPSNILLSLWVYFVYNIVITVICIFNAVIGDEDVKELKYNMEWWEFKYRIHYPEMRNPPILE